jgi:CHAT domain-containing protein
MDKSQAFALEALSVFEKAVGKTHPLYALGLNSVSTNYRFMNMKQEAVLRTEELRLAIQNPAVRETLEAYDYAGTIGNEYLYEKDWDRCIEYSCAELLRFNKLYPKQYSKQGFLTSIITKAFEQSGRLNQAADYALLQCRAILQDLQENYSGFSEKEQALFFNNYAQVYMTPFLFSIRHPEFSELTGAGFDYQMTVKGMSMANRRQLLQSLRAHPDAVITAQFEEWQQLQTLISKEYALTPARRQANLDSLVGRANELERNLAIGSEAFRMASKEAHWQDVRAALAPGEAAIEFGQLHKLQEDSTFCVAWVLRQYDDYPRLVYLFEEREIGSLTAIRHLYGTEEASSSGKNLQSLVWKPLEPLLNGISTLYYAPAGVLYQVNIGAIPVSSSETLADRFLLHQLISTRQIMSLKNTPDFVLPTSALVFGGIRYESDSLALASTNGLMENDQDAWISNQRGGFIGDDWAYLSGSYQEAVSVRNRLNAAGAQVVFADGFQASEGYFKKIVQSSPSLLHLATHGFFIATTDSSARTGFASAENPMARAGLALSGANRVWSGNPAFEGQEDGVLTALEISRLNLDGTQLAVLSACGTGQGKIALGEGVLGLQRGLKMAGVRYVIMTLWNVQDVHAQQFMDLFYEAWLQRKLPVPQAFRMAQHQMRIMYSKPFQPMAWAGFLLLE